MAMLDGNDGCSKAAIGCLVFVALILVVILIVLMVVDLPGIAFFAFVGLAVVAVVAYMIFHKQENKPEETVQSEAVKDVPEIENQPSTGAVEAPKPEKKEFISLERLQEILANEKDDRKKVFIENYIKCYDILKDRHDNALEFPKDPKEFDSEKYKTAQKQFEAFRDKMVANQLVIGDEMAVNADAYRKLSALIDENDCDKEWIIDECISGYQSSSFEEAPTLDFDLLLLITNVRGLNWVGTYCNVPCFIVSDAKYYIYPNFIVKVNEKYEDPNLDYEILSFDDMEVNFVKIRYKEYLWDDVVHDAKRLGTWYDNRGNERPINEYGAVEIPKLNVTLVFSNAFYAKQLAEAMNEFFSIKVSSEKAERHLGSEELDALIGLTTVKQEVNTLRNYIKIQQEREKNGLKPTQVSYHCVFTGNPGTGKTTVARIVAQIYKELGVLKKGHLIETDRSGLVAEYVGQTAVKTDKIIDKALDGVLFIDEAYSLVNGDESDYGRESIATLLKRMEDNRDRLVVILAGYSDEMKAFIDSNPGLQSRFNRYIHFPDYSEDEMFRIFCLRCEKSDYVITEDAKARLMDLLAQSVVNKDKNFGNGRFVRNLFEKTVEHQANRLAKMENLTPEMLSRIEKEDVGL
ncbi:MAG: AAA family ATPase [Bacteroidales bacterium]|nr:AAA family ATPase [Bacteroidales bacterium]